MTSAGRSCALFLRDGQIGIVTDDDFRRRVATGEVGVDAPISAIASIPAIAMSTDRTVSTAYLFMVEHGIHHLVVVDAVGTAVGIVRVVDMAAAEVRNPLVIRSAAAAATTMDELVDACRLLTPTTVELWDAGLPVEHLGALLSAMIESIFRKIVELHSDDVAIGRPGLLVDADGLARADASRCPTPTSTPRWRGCPRARPTWRSPATRSPRPPNP